MAFNNIFKSKKVLITGNTGFKGSWLSTWLNIMGADVYGYSINIPTKPSMFESLKLDKKINQYYFIVLMWIKKVLLRNLL